MNLSSAPLFDINTEGRKGSPIHESVYAALCNSLLLGEFVPGVSVTLRGIADQLGVSPMPIRDAIRRLVAEGALEVLVNRRVSVAPMNQRRLDELFQARLSLEPVLAVAALSNLRQQHIKNLVIIDESINESLKQGNVENYIRLNHQFHFGIYKHAKSPVLMPLVKSLWLQFAPFSRIVFGRVGTDFIDDYHADAIEAMKNNDKKALEAAICSDVTEGMSILAKQLR